MGLLYRGIVSSFSILRDVGGVNTDWSSPGAYYDAENFTCGFDGEYGCL